MDDAVIIRFELNTVKLKQKHRGRTVELHFENGDDVISYTVNAESHQDPQSDNGLAWFRHDDLPGFEENDFLGSTLRIKTFMVILHNVFFATCYITLIFIEIKDLNTIQIFITYEFLLNLFCKFKAGFI